VKPQSWFWCDNGNPFFLLSARKEIPDQPVRQVPDKEWGRKNPFLLRTDPYEEMESQDPQEFVRATEFHLSPFAGR